MGLLLSRMLATILVQQYLGHISRQPSESLIHRRRLASDNMEENGVGDEERVHNLLTSAAIYSRRFIAEAENIDISHLWVGSCEKIQHYLFQQPIFTSFLHRLGG